MIPPALVRKINRCSGRLEYLGSLKDRANFGPIEVERPLKTSAQEKNSAREAKAGARQSGEKPFDPPGHGLSFGCSHDKSHSMVGLHAWQTSSTARAKLFSRYMR